VVGAEDVAVGEAVPEIVFAVAERADIEEFGAVAGVAVKEEHRGLAASERDAAARTVSRAGKDRFYHIGIFRFHHKKKSYRRHSHSPTSTIAG